MAQWSDFISRSTGSGYEVSGLRRGEERFDAESGTFVAKAEPVKGFFSAKTKESAIDGAIRAGYVKGTITAEPVEPSVVALPLDIFNALSATIATNDRTGRRVYETTPNEFDSSYDDLRRLLSEVLPLLKSETND